MAEVGLVSRVEDALAQLARSKPVRRCRFSQADGRYHIEHRERVTGGVNHGSYVWKADASFGDIDQLAAYLGVDR